MLCAYFLLLAANVHSLNYKQLNMREQFLMSVEIVLTLAFHTNSESIQQISHILAFLTHSPFIDKRNSASIPVAGIFVFLYSYFSLHYQVH